jgi:FkbM family methyltransferase
MYLIGSVKRSLGRAGLTLKRFEFPHDHPFDLLPMVVDSFLTPGFTVVQIGANDGVSDDPAGEIIRAHRLRAVLVEPIVAMHRKLAAYYADFPEVACENCAISWEDGTMTLYSVRPDPGLPPYVNRLASFDRRIILKQRGVVPNIARFIEPVQVPALRLESLLRKHDLTRLDWLQLDTEGFDFEILKMLWRTPFRPKVIGFESLHLSRGDKLACAAALRREGYRYVTIDRDTIALREAAPRPPDTGTGREHKAASPARRDFLRAI